MQPAPAAPIEEPAPARPSTDQFGNLSGEERTAIAFVATVAIHYEQCGGRLTPEAKNTVARARYELGGLIKEFSRQFKTVSCNEIRRSYEDAAESFTSRPEVRQ